jgi:hypothetical protein
MTTTPHSPDEDAPPTRDEEFDESGRFVGDDTPAPDDDDAAGDRGDEGLDEEPPAIQPRS